MDYLIVSLWPWLVAALAIGFVVGWISCSPRDDEI